MAEGEEAGAGPQVWCYAKTKETTTQVTSTEPVSLQCQIPGA